ncbi:GNAT family N-acetyltransferase [Epibacterium sp. Ofav1-8]|nr:GNAT family N-acetyltransferase [Epibacterium sp. Ofav1-8]
MRFYRTFHNFDSTFVYAVSAALDLVEGQMSKVRKFYLIAECGGQPVGCIFLSAETSTVSRIRLFYLDEAYRGRGTGKRLLSAVVTAAREKEFKSVRVSTFDRHPEACGLYESAGFEAVRTVRSMAFGQDMQQVDYELLLAGGDL